MIYILIGSIGSGKTSLGQLLAQKLNYKLLELDQLALVKTGFATVAQALQNDPLLLKEKELEVCKELSQQDDLVIIFGGSAIFNQLNFDYFDKNQKAKKVIYLSVNHQNQLERVLSKHPNLKSDQAKQNTVATNLIKMNQEREFLFKSLADITISTSENSPEQALAIVLKSK